MDPGAEYWPEGDLPEQFGGQRTTLMPAQYTFRLPANLAQLWHDVEVEDSRPFLPNGQPNPSKGQKIKRKQLKFDRNAPLVVEGGASDGQPMTATFTNNPRPRGKKDDAKTPWISELAYFLAVGLKDPARPTMPEELIAAINRYAGKTIRLETGLSAQCRPDKVRYMAYQVVENGAASEIVQPDSTGQKGCGARYYLDTFKDPTTGKYDQEITCGKCGAALRGFESVERILPPLGS